jgi:hypothetical protein
MIRIFTMAQYNPTLCGAKQISDAAAVGLAGGGRLGWRSR